MKTGTTTPGLNTTIATLAFPGWPLGAFGWACSVIFPVCVASIPTKSLEIGAIWQLFPTHKKASDAPPVVQCRCQTACNFMIRNNCLVGSARNCRRTLRPRPRRTTRERARWLANVCFPSNFRATPAGPIMRSRSAEGRGRVRPIMRCAARAWIRAGSSIVAVRVIGERVTV